MDESAKQDKVRYYSSSIWRTHELDVKYYKKYGLARDSEISIAYSRKKYWRLSSTKEVYRALTTKQLYR